MSMRADLRSSAVQAIIDASTSAGGRVYASSTRKLEGIDLREVGPAIVVWVTSEDMQHIGQSPIYQARTTVNIEAWASAGDDDALDELTDALAEEIKAALMTSAWPAQVERVASITVRTDTGYRADTSRELVGRVQVEIVPEYKAEFEQADAFADFTEVAADTDIPPADGVSDISWVEEAA